jgi:hypothetical protein
VLLADVEFGSDIETLEERIVVSLLDRKNDLSTKFQQTELN